MTAIEPANDDRLDDAIRESEQVVRSLQHVLAEIGELRKDLDELERQHERERQPVIVLVPTRRWGFRRVI